MSIPKFSTEQPVFVNLFMVLLLIIGVFSFISIPKEEWPEISVNTVTIKTIYPGAAPEEIEELITKPIEDEVLVVEDVWYIASFTSEGRSTVNVYFDPDIKDYYRKLQEVQTEVNKVKGLPEGAQDPEVDDYSIPFQLITIGIVGDGVEKEIKKIAEDMSSELKKIYGVKDAELSGDRDREIWVEVDPSRLESYGLSLDMVMASLRRKNLNLPGGTIKLSGNEFILRTVGEATQLKEIEDVVIRESSTGGHVLLKDIATVKDTFAEPRIISRINGKKGIAITVAQSDEGNIADIVEEIRAVVKTYEERLPEGAEIIFINDNSLYLKARLGILYSNAVTGFILVVLSLFLFIGARPALVTAIGIPVAFSSCFLLMEIMGLTVNSLSLFAIIVVLGMVVDDGIVVTENVYRYIEKGLPIKEAARIGAEEVFWPILAAVSTTMAAFLPMLMMTGILGNVMSVIPKVVIFALAGSLWEAFLILPSHLADFARPPKANKYRGADSAWFKKMHEKYTLFLGKVLRKRYYAVAAIFCAATAIFLTAVGTVDFVLFPNPDFDTFLVKLEAPASINIEEADRMTSAVTDIIQSFPETEVLSLKTQIGQKIANLGARDGGMEYGSNLSEVEVRLTNYQDRERSGVEILDEIREKVSHLDFADCYKISVMRMGPPVGKPVAVRVEGDDFRTLSLIAEKVMEELETVTGVVDIEQDFLPGKEEIRIKVDEEKAALYKLSVEQVARTVQYAYLGGVATEFKEENENIDVVVKFDEKTRDNLQGILNLKVRNSEGSMIILKNVASLEQTQGYSKIRRRDQKRIINVTANIIEAENNSRDVIHEIEKRTAPFMKLFPGYVLSFGGEFEDTKDSMTSLFKAFGVAIFLIYLILATMFKSFIQPFLLMFSIPFSVMGVFVGVIIMQVPIGMMVFLGIIGLSGIVVNDSIVLIDFINRRKAEADKSEDRFEVTIDACKTRLRPILLTSITTILGLMPLALGIFGREFMMTPMAISIVWGLTLSSVLTLFIIPCFYTILEDIKRRNGSA